MESNIKKVTQSESSKTSRKSFVFSGGGAYAASELGIVNYILSHDLFDPSQDMAIGTSFGAISAGALALGFSDKKMINMLKVFAKTVQAHLSGWSLAWSMLSFPYTYGLDNLMIILSPYFGGDVKEQESLITVATDLVNWRPVYINHTLRDLANISILEAISASASIPLLFQPVKISHYLCIDGGVMDNFPIDVAYNTDIIYAFGTPIEDYHDSTPTKDIPSYFSNLINGAIYRMNKDILREIPKSLKDKVNYCKYSSHATNTLDFSHYEEDFHDGYIRAKSFFESKEGD